MIANKIKVKSKRVTIELPDEYIGKEIEYLILPLTSKKESVSKVAGSLKKYADVNKIKDEEKAWELYVKDKFQ